MIDTYRKSSEKSAAQIEKELLTLSYVLIRTANTLRIAHDEKFQNLYGMKMMYQNVIYLATEGESGMSSVSSSMRKVYGLLSSTPEVFDRKRQISVHQKARCQESPWQRGKTIIKQLCFTRSGSVPGQQGPHNNRLSQIHHSGRG